jgi:two-component system LytT family response regulator
MIKAMIIDDEKASIEVIKALTEKLCPEIQIVATADNVKKATEEILHFEPDILFLDIELGDGLGFEILEKLPDLSARVIFITAFEHYAIRAIKFHAFEYILKPILPEELESVLQKVVSDIKKKTFAPDTQALLRHLKGDSVKKIAVPSKNGLHYYLIDNIVCIEGEGSYAKMYLVDTKTVMVTRRIKDFEECLADKGFLRVHKSYLVNVNHICELHKDDGGYLLMSNNKNVPIRMRDREGIISLIKDSSYVI